MLEKHELDVVRLWDNQENKWLRRSHILEKINECWKGDAREWIIRGGKIERRLDRTLNTLRKKKIVERRLDEKESYYRPFGILQLIDKELQKALILIRMNPSYPFISYVDSDIDRFFTLRFKRSNSRLVRLMNNIFIDIEHGCVKQSEIKKFFRLCLKSSDFELSRSLKNSILANLEDSCIKNSHINELLELSEKIRDSGLRSSPIHSIVADLRNIDVMIITNNFELEKEMRLYGSLTLFDFFVTIRNYFEAPKEGYHLTERGLAFLIPLLNDKDRDLLAQQLERFKGSCQET